MFGRKTSLMDRIESQSSPMETPGLGLQSPSEALQPVGPPPPRVRRPHGGLLSALSGLLTFVAVLALAIVAGVALLEQKVSEPGPLAEDKIVVIPRNSGTNDIANLLRREGVIAR